MPTKPACPNDNNPVRPVNRLTLNTARLKISAVITMLIQNAPNVSGNAATMATAAISKTLEPFPFRLNRNGAPDSLFDAFSSREPVPTSLESALDILVDSFGHQTAREEDQRQHQEAERDRGRIAVRNVNRAKTLDHADQERAEDGA